MSLYFDVAISFVTLTLLEIILSVDNILLITIVSTNIDPKYQNLTRRIGVIVAVIGRIALLIVLHWLTGFNKSLFYITNMGFSINSLIMIIGGMYLIYYANLNIFNEIKHKKHNKELQALATSSVIKALNIILFFDSLFSFDSVLTAISLGKNLWVMIIAILVSVMVLFISINKISNFINKNQPIKLLALSFLILVGFELFVSGFGIDTPKIYIFIVMVFSAFVQFITIKLDKK